MSTFRYLGICIEEDAGVEDRLYAELHSDPRSMRHREMAVEEYQVKNYQFSQ